MKKTYIPMMLLAMSQLTSAQNGWLNSETFNRAEGVLQQGLTDVEHEYGQHYIANPALLNSHLQNRRAFTNAPDSTPDSLRHISIAVDLNKGKFSGDYLPTEGNNFRRMGLHAFGFHQEAKATLMGQADFSFGQDKNIGWNTFRFPEIYWPYIVADSTGGNKKYERYHLLGAYGYRMGKLDVGVKGAFTGDFAYRETDPRIENISSFLNLDAGVSYPLGNNRLAFNFGYQLHRQTMDLKHFRSGQFAGFLMEYGFGQYDYIFSPIYNSMKQVQHQHHYAFDLAFLSDARKAFRNNVNVGYTKEVMDCEEDIYKLNLYNAKTGTWRVNYGAIYDNRSIGLQLVLDASGLVRNGQENLFEKYVSATVDGVDVYDYKQFGSLNRYQMTQNKVKGLLKFSGYVSRQFTLSLIGQVDYFKREETYSEDDYLISNTLLTPAGGIELNLHNNKFEASLRGMFAKQTVADSKYRVDLTLERETEYQHAFATYAYYAAEGNMVSGELMLKRKLAKLDAGVKVQVSLMNADRLDDATYNAERCANARPSTAHNTIQLAPDEHDVFDGKLTFFTEF